MIGDVTGAVEEGDLCGVRGCRLDDIVFAGDEAPLSGDCRDLGLGLEYFSEGREGLMIRLSVNVDGVLSVLSLVGD